MQKVNYNNVEKYRVRSTSRHEESLTPSSKTFSNDEMYHMRRSMEKRNQKKGNRYVMEWTHLSYHLRSNEEN
jgi:hypothetical protein